MTIKNVIKAAYADGAALSKGGLGYVFEIHLKSGKQIELAPTNGWVSAESRGYLLDNEGGIFIPFESVEYIIVRVIA